MRFLALLASVLALAGARADDLIASYRDHLERANKWYLPSRLGAFYHWGLYTGGGCRVRGAYEKPLTYPSPAAFETAAPDPQVVARNLAVGAKDLGANYTILTLWHTCGGHMVLYPTKLPEFRNKTKQDYIAAYLDEARKLGIHPMLYFPTDCNNWNFDPQNPTMNPSVTDCFSPAFTAFLGHVMDELKERYGSRIEGFWIDGGFPGTTGDVCKRIRAQWPDAVIVGNNATDFRRGTFAANDMTTPRQPVDVDISTTEDCPPHDTKPDYCRPAAFRSLGVCGGALAQRDLNEDDLTIGGWWYGERKIDDALVRDPRIFVKRVVSSLGQRGRWNCAIGVGPRIDGTLPTESVSIVDCLRRFLAWAGPAIYGTKGPAGTFFDPGYAGAVNGGTCAAFYSVTQSLNDPNIFYVLVTEANLAPEKRNVSIFQTNGHAPRRVTDLRTGRDYAFTTPYGVLIEDIDWSDINSYGATVLKFEF